MNGIDSCLSKGLHLKIMVITTRKILIAIFVLGVIAPCCLIVVALLIASALIDDGFGVAIMLAGFVEIEGLVILFCVIPLMLCVALAGWGYSALRARKKKAEEDQIPPPQPSPTSGEGE
jgi:hypothetical protein